jgi:flagellar export protein FliJ
MRKALAALLRVRDAHKKVAERDFGAAERARIIQEEEVEGLHRAVISSHTGDELGYPGGDASWLAIEHSYRLRMQVRIRKEQQVLVQRAQDAAAQRERLIEADRERRVVEIALEQHDAEVALELRRADGRKLDALAGARWWRENAS